MKNRRFVFKVLSCCYTILRQLNHHHQVKAIASITSITWDQEKVGEGRRHCGCHSSILGLSLWCTPIVLTRSSPGRCTSWESFDSSTEYLSRPLLAKQGCQRPGASTIPSEENLSLCLDTSALRRGPLSSNCTRPLSRPPERTKWRILPYTRIRANSVPMQLWCRNHCSHTKTSIPSFAAAKLMNASGVRILRTSGWK